MQVLFPTGRQSEAQLSSALADVTEFEYIIVSVGEIASFLAPNTLVKLIEEYSPDLAVVSGMCTASFDLVEKKTGVPVRKGTRHAADMRLCVPLIISEKLSGQLPADDLLLEEKKVQATQRLREIEELSTPEFTIRGVKFGGDSRIKVIHEIMDAHTHPNLRSAAEHAIAFGADGIDLGFGFDAKVSDVIRCFTELSDLSIPLSIDTVDPDLIRASLFRADLIFSLTSETLPLLADDVRCSNAAAVLISRDGDLLETVALAKNLGLENIFADPLLLPPLSGFTKSLAGYLKDYGCPKILGCVNVVEMVDADSPGMCALLASAAAEAKAAAVLISEHSDKTRGATREMRRACEMAALSKGRPYPKDVGADVFVIKEKRKRREPDLVYSEVLDAALVPDKLEYDPKGNFRIGVEDGYIVAVRNGKAIRGVNWYEVFSEILAEDGVSLLDHAAYLGKELYKAELAIKFGRSFEQDGEF